MTGFARARRPLGAGEIVVSLKTVNHRGLDVHIRGPSTLDQFENLIRAVIKGRISRGHVEAAISLPESVENGAAPRLNRALLDEYVRAFRAAAGAHGIKAQPDLNAALRIPGMFGESTDREPAPGTQEALIEALEAAVNELNAFREREGAEIAADMRRHNAVIASSAAEMERIRQGAAPAFQRRLTERLGELLQGVAVDPQRLAQEAAILADRSDISEELARLKIHAGQLSVLLDQGGEAGKKLDFLLQEMNRETNTILSKTNGAGEPGLRITDLALAAKTAIEKIREQSLNLE